jgi:hypothetical protein
MLKKVIALTLTLTVLFLSLLLPLRLGISQQAPAATISVQPIGNSGLTLGQTFSINITVSNVTDCYAWQAFLYYQSAVLNGTVDQNGNPELQEGPFLSSGGSTFFVLSNFTDYYNATYGVIGVADTLVGPVAGVSGSGTLATINFTAVGSGSSVLDLDDAELFNSSEPFPSLIPSTTIDGWAYTGLVHVTVSNMQTLVDIPQGAMDYVNVTAENMGGIIETFDVTLYENDNPIGTQTIVNLAGGGTQTLNFAWDTTPIPIGEYTLTANASQVPGETDLSDKSFSVNVFVGIIDLATTNVSPYRISIPLGWSGINVYVTVNNKGVETETFNVSLYAGSNLIGTQETAVVSEGSETLTFAWNTSTLYYGNYTLLGSIPPIPFDTDTADKNFSTSAAITIPGDVNAEGKVDMGDIVTILRAFGSTSVLPNWNPNCDLEDNGRIDMGDVVIALRNFGQHYP